MENRANSRGCHRQRLLGETRLRLHRRRRRQLQQLAAVAAAATVAVATARKRDLLSGASRNAHNEALK